VAGKDSKSISEAEASVSVSEKGFHPESILPHDSSVLIGVLALQGDVEKHVEMVEKCGARAIRVRFADEIDIIDGLIIPGGESTTVGKLMARYGIDTKIIERAAQGMPVFGTCTGMILMSKEIVGSEQHRLGLMDTTVLRNAFGRQVDSFEADLDIKCIGGSPVRAVFIRAPYAVEIRGNAEVLARCNDKAVLLKQGNLLACAFHPELTDDCRLHQYFIGLAKTWLESRSTPPPKE
jgi:5'-phosphate synthase pdxT subunit